VIRHLGLADYQGVYDAMVAFNSTRDADTPDQIWIVEHPPVFTQGLAGKPEHILSLGEIPLIKTDRGGQVTYHGPGQVVIYPLLDLKRLGRGPKALVHGIEQVLIDYLAGYKLTAERHAGAPGVYVNQRKIASLGLRIRRGCCYHGLALNIDMDLEPFSRINPCGYAGLQMVQLSEFAPEVDVNTAGIALALGLIEHFKLRIAQ
jgi:lipoyl(octanoyl) transferase